MQGLGKILQFLGIFLYLVYKIAFPPFLVKGIFCAWLCE